MSASGMITLPDLPVMGTVLRHVGGVLVLTLLSACSTPHRSYYGEASTIIPAAKGEAAIAVIEFDERGDYWDKAQLTRADELIKPARNPILVTYVHGWRHDARPSDTDLRSFRNFVNQIASDPIAQSSKRQVIGVFIGWRGASVQEEGITGLFGKPSALLSFWGRKKITDQMAGVPFNNTIWSLAKRTRDCRGHSILIGHSFGGRIVERTLGPAAIAQMNNGEPMPYNLTFLINPATESLYARQLKLALRDWQKTSEPAIIAIAATNDTATGRAWPPALTLPTGIRSRKYQNEDASIESQNSYVRTTVGNDKRQWTHEVKKVGQAPITKPNIVASNVNDSSDAFQIRLPDDPPGTVSLFKLGQHPDARTNHPLNSNAYWVLPVDPNILSGHGGDPAKDGIFCTSMGDLMSGLIGNVEALTTRGAVVPKSRPERTDGTPAPKPVFELPRLSVPF